MKRIYHLLVVALFITLSGCATTPETQEQEGVVETLYNKGMDELESGSYIDAIDTFNELERQHPYSWWANRAQVMVTFAHYKREEHDEAITSADRFIRLHPGHEDLAYMLYIKGLSYYERISDVRRDQGFTEEALRAFEELTARFPESEYVVDTKLKITLCKDHLAGKEMAIARFYQQQQRFVAAINRFRNVIEVYQTTSQTPEALYRLTETYLATGIRDEAQAAAAVLGHNFPTSEWYEDAYKLLKGQGLEPKESKQSWLGKVKGIF